MNFIKSLFSRLKQLLAMEPVLVAWLLNGGVAALLAFVLHLSKTETAAITTIVTALVTIYTAAKTKPARVSVIAGSLTTLLVACSAFGLHLSASMISTIVVVLAAVIPQLIRMHVSPRSK